MFPAFILGVALLAGVLLAGRWYAMADTKTLLAVLKWVLMSTVVSVVLFFYHEWSASLGAGGSAGVIAVVFSFASCGPSGENFRPYAPVVSDRVGWG